MAMFLMKSSERLDIFITLLQDGGMPPEETTMTTFADPHHDLHGEQGALRGEHSGRSANPIIKVRDLAWLEFEKPDLKAAVDFGLAFGLTVHDRTPEAVYLRGTWSNSVCIVVRKGSRSRFLGPAFHADETADLRRLAVHADAGLEPTDEIIGGQAVRLFDPSGHSVSVIHGAHELPALADQHTAVYNSGTRTRRVNDPARPPREPARVQRLGHYVMMTTSFRRDLNWYLDHFGLIVSDFLFLEGQRDRGPTMAFIRCDRGSEPSDHHTMAMTLGPDPGYVHSAYQVADLDALAAGGQYLQDSGYKRVWGIGRHIQGSQIFDYWHDPDRLMMEHFTDGDRFDASVETGWSPMTSANLSQWGPPVSKEFLGIEASPRLAAAAVQALRQDNELDASRLLALMKAMSP